MEDTNKVDLNLNDMIDLVFNHKFEIVLLMLIFLVVGYVYTMNLVKPKYTSSTTLVLVSQPKLKNDTKEVVDSSITDSDVTLNSKLLSTYNEIITSKAVLRQVKDTLNLDIEDNVLKKKITVNSVKDSGVLEILVTFDNSKQAAQIANEIAKAFVEKNEELYKIDNVKILDLAEENNEPTNINHIRDMIVFGLIGIIFSMAYILIFWYFDDTIKVTDNIEKKYKVSLLVSIPVYTTSTSKKKGDE